MRYFIADGPTQRGPYELAELWGKGIRPDTLVWQEGAPQWQRADQVDELVAAGLFSPQGGPAHFPPPPPPPYGRSVPPYQSGVPSYNPANSNRVPAGVCAILLGAFGVHKFILGMNTAGIIMLAITLLSCGFAGPVIGVIGIIEGVLYLTKTDEEFHEIYVVQKRDWF